jgi:hypothetical protein
MGWYAKRAAGDSAALGFSCWGAVRGEVDTDANEQAAGLRRLERRVRQVSEPGEAHAGHDSFGVRADEPGVHDGGDGLGEQERGALRSAVAVDLHGVGLQPARLRDRAASRTG